MLTMFLHLAQPVARLYGRVREGLTPWRHETSGLALPRPATASAWTEEWRAPDERLRLLEAALRAERVQTMRGGSFDRWDLEVRGGMLGAVRALMTVEEHGSGRQMTRVRVQPRYSPAAGWLTLALSAVALGAASDASWSAAAILGMMAAAPALRAMYECASATFTTLRALRALGLESGRRVDR
jgi:hypothetical protein